MDGDAGDAVAHDVCARTSIIEDRDSTDKDASLACDMLVHSALTPDLWRSVSSRIDLSVRLHFGLHFTRSRSASKRVDW